MYCSPGRLVRGCGAVGDSILLIRRFVRGGGRLYLSNFTMGGKGSVYLPCRTACLELSPGDCDGCVIVRPLECERIGRRIAGVLSGMKFGNVFSIRFLVNGSRRLCFLRMGFHGSA